VEGIRKRRIYLPELADKPEWLMTVYPLNDEFAVELSSLTKQSVAFLFSFLKKSTLNKNPADEDKK
jgi:hypothetical protein